MIVKKVHATMAEHALMALPLIHVFVRLDLPDPTARQVCSNSLNFVES